MLCQSECVCLYKTVNIGSFLCKNDENYLSKSESTPLQPMKDLGGHSGP